MHYEPQSPRAPEPQSPRAPEPQSPRAPEPQSPRAGQSAGVPQAVGLHCLATGSSYHGSTVADELTVWRSRGAGLATSPSFTPQPHLSPTLGDHLVSPFGTISPPLLGTINVAQVWRSGIRTCNLYLPSEVKKVRPQKWKNKRLDWASNPEAQHPEFVTLPSHHHDVWFLSGCSSGQKDETIEMYEN
ncbi:hypothetical protein COCON_G00228290 [Conger conger]|uniref:Uncharacterized protein n=1 Tax=Conger conger TaxID=82655 RepID=A0A9Q1CV00_CONCO|nr:hypothetical protein COCON_G00228290 [Conger conger]